MSTEGVRRSRPGNCNPSGFMRAPVFKRLRRGADASAFRMTVVRRSCEDSLPRSVPGLLERAANAAGEPIRRRHA